ncbi:MAG: ABC transporter substrate-binding protein [Thaumarchaeota archaeon]|nr:ABC transporter substrate-binding protein [Nitrososphaerota archaeon]
MIVERGIATVVERDPADEAPVESDPPTSDLRVSMTAFSDRFAVIKEDVVKITRDAIAAYESDGDASLDAMTAGSSAYDVSDPYPFVVDSETMIIVAHGFIPERVGMVAEPFLTSGVTFDELRSELESEGSLWLMYTFIDPESSHNATKKAYLELHDGLIFGSGFYPDGLEVQMMKTMWVVSNAVEMYDESGIDAFGMINDAAADYVPGDIYPFASSLTTMNVVAHGADPSRVGDKSVVLTDANKDLERILLESEMNGGTWVAYTFNNFETGAEETKLSWVVARDDYILGAGFYPDEYQAPKVHAIMSTDNALFLYAQYGEDAFPKITALNVTEEWYPFVSDGEIGLEIADGSILDRTGVLYWEAHEFNAAYGPVMDILESGHGAYISYVFLNPETDMQQAKKAWIVLHDGYIFGAGFYLTGVQGDVTAVKWSVDTSVELYKLQGAEDAFAAITSMESTFESYPFVIDSDSFDLVAHGADPSLVGSNVFDLVAPDKDRDQIMADLSDGDGATTWAKYVFANPETGMDAEKTVLLKMHDGYIFAAGYYQDDDGMAQTDGAAEAAVVKLKWIDSAQFAGIYTADQNGYYRDNGMTVAIEPFGLGSTSIEDVVSGAADFGVTGADELLVAQSNGADVRALAVIYQQSPLVAMALEESGITEPKDFVGMKFGAPGSESEFIIRSMLASQDVDYDNDITVVPLEFDISPLLDGDLDVMAAYLIDQPLIAEDRGHGTTIIRPADYGVNFYGDVLFTSNDLIQNNPDLVQGFVDATLAGWEYALENVGESVSHTLLYVEDDVGISESHQQRMLQASIPLIKPGGMEVGQMSHDKWTESYELLLGSKIIDSEIDVSESYTTEFLN